MRITFDHQAFSLQNKGGITRYFYELMRHFCKAEGVELDVLLGFSSTIWPLRDLLNNSGRLQHWGPRLVDFGMPTYALNELLLSLTNVTRAPADIYHNTLYRFMPALKAKHYVATHHDCIQERYPDLFPDRARIMKAKRKMFERADLIFCVSESSRADLETFYGVEPSRCKVVYNGVSPMQNPSQGIASLQILPQRPFVLYVGMRAAYKNFNGFLQAFAATNLKTSYDIVVIGGEPFTSNERELLRTLQLETAVCAIPSATPATLAAAYAGAALLVYPSLYEGFGLPPLEAMLVGTPALVAACPATIEVCHGAAIFFDPIDPDNFCTQLQRALEDRDLRQQSIAAGLVLANQYQWRSTAEQVMAAYQSLL